MVSRFCGAAIAADALAIARESSPAAVWRRPLDACDGASWPSLTLALREAVSAGVVKGPLAIAVLPPLVEVRSVTIPPVSDADARRLLTRAASRHFLNAREPLDVTVGSSQATTGRLAAAVPSRVLRAVLDAARDAGVQIDVIVPTHVAWVQSASSRSGATYGVLVEYDDTRELVTATSGAPIAVRRFRMQGDEQAMADAVQTLDSAPRTITDALTAAATAMGADVRTPWPFAFGSLSGAEPGPRGDTRSWWMFGAAAVFALGTVALQELDVRRELDAVRAQRASIAAAVSAVQRASSDDDRAHVAELERTPRWSGVIATLSDALPADAYLTRLRAHGDTLEVTGRAARATDAYSALASAPWVQRLAASAPVRRETADDGTVTESFEFTIVLGSRP